MGYKVVAMTEQAADQAAKACSYAARQSEMVKELKQLNGKPTEKIDLAIEWLDWLASMIANGIVADLNEPIYVDVTGVAPR